MTVNDLLKELQHLAIWGHGDKEVGFPEGIHSSEFERMNIEENADGDEHPGFVWIEVKRGFR